MIRIDHFVKLYALLFMLHQVCLTTTFITLNLLTS